MSSFWVQRVLRQNGQPLTGTGARLLRPGHAAKTEQTLERAHMPQLSADLLAHLDAVAGVVLAAARAVVDDAQILLDHVLVALKAAGGDDDAVQRAHVALLALAADLHADDGAGGRLLNQLDGRGLKPDVQLVLVLEQGGADGVVELHAAELVGAHQRDLVAALKFRVLRAHVAQHRHAGTRQEAGGIAVVELGLDGLPHVGNAANDGFQHVVRHVAAAGELLVVLEGRLIILIAVGKELTADLGVAAGERVVHLLGDEYGSAGVGGGHRGVHAGKAHAQHDDVVLRVPLDGIGIGVGLFGGSEGRAAHRGQSAQRCAALEEAAAGKILHSKSSFLILLVHKHG